MRFKDFHRYSRDEARNMTQRVQFTEDEISAAVDAYTGGESAPSIARRTDKHPNMVRRVIGRGSR